MAKDQGRSRIRPLVSGHQPPTAAAGQVEPFAKAGATWWLAELIPQHFGKEWQDEWPLDAMRDYLGERVSVLEKAVEKFPALNHQGHQASACVEDTESATWLYDAVHEALIDEIDFDDEDVVRELKQVDRILAPLASRVGR